MEWLNMNNQIKIFNCETGEEFIREATQEELKQLELDAQRAQEIQDEAAVKAAQRQAILDRLGITDQEAKLLLG
jgi:hypothetical protein